MVLDIGKDESGKGRMQENPLKHGCCCEEKEGKCSTVKRRVSLTKSALLTFNMKFDDDVARVPSGPTSMAAVDTERDPPTADTGEETSAVQAMSILDAWTAHVRRKPCGKNPGWDGVNAMSLSRTH